MATYGWMDVMVPGFGRDYPGVISSTTLPRGLSTSCVIGKKDKGRGCSLGAAWSCCY
jgi:hypothetical protein